jgi:hypothetical protein
VWGHEDRPALREFAVPTRQTAAGSENPTWCPGSALAETDGGLDDAPADYLCRLATSPGSGTGCPRVTRGGVAHRAPGRPGVGSQESTDKARQGARGRADGLQRQTVTPVVIRPLYPPLSRGRVRAVLASPNGRRLDDRGPTQRS